MSSPFPQMRDRTTSRCSANVNNPIPHSASSDMVALAHKPDYSVEIPVEIWETLCEPTYLCFLYEEDYSAMSLACRFFRDIFQKMVFRHLFHREGWGLWEEEEEEEEDMARFIKRLEWLDANPRFMTFIRSCNFYGFPDARIQAGIEPEHLAAHQSTTLLFFRLLKGFTGLQQIDLSYIKINERLLSDLAGLLMLEFAHFEMVHFTCRSLPSRLITLKELYIEDTNETDSITRPPFQLFSNKRLRTLHLASLKEAAECLAHLILQGLCENLQKLSVGLDGSRDLPTLFRFLATCPRLKSIEICGINLVPISSHIPDSISTLLPPSALPQLREYSGPDEIAAMLAPNRPVFSVALFKKPWTNEVWEEKGISTLHQISRSSGPVQKLELPILPPRPEVLVKIADNFPALKILTMVLDDTTPCSEEDTDTSDLLPEIRVDEQRTPLSSPNSFKGLVERMCLKKLKLPHSLEYLSIIDNIQPLYGYSIMSYPNKRCLTRREQQRAVCELSKHYPSLSSVTLGSGDQRWIKDVRDDLWIDPFNPLLKLSLAEYEAMLMEAPC